MITADGYSKDPGIMPEGIAVTFGKDMMKDQGGAKQFLSYFNGIMSDADSWWMHKMKNKPSRSFARSNAWSVMVICIVMVLRLMVFYLLRSG